ncbi:MAG: hypothetical protein HC824_21510 [Synechococcales cyanobacterium RM1_1_8]|nr:hypothetical protein [Synechococcales cyanobacterium RM1_1_8]
MFWLRGWSGLFGPTVTNLRLFSVVLGLLLLPAVYGLCQELFPGTWVGAIALALVAQSPFHLLYAQEARPYSLWALLIAMSQLALLRALRLKTASAWLLYGLSFAAGLYCHLLHGLVLIGQAAFVAWQEWRPQGEIGGLGSWRKSLSRGTGRNFGGACLLGSLLFAPWALFAMINFDNFQTATAGATASSQGLQPALGELIKGWVKGWNLMLLDFNLDETAPRPLLLALGLLLGINLVWMAIALYQFIRWSDRLPKQLLLASIGTTAALLILPDFAIGGHRSGAFRYWLPALLSMQLVMAFVLSRWLEQGPRRWGQLLLIGLLAMGLISNSAMVMSWSWWSKDSANANLDIPALVRDYHQAPGQPTSAQPASGQQAASHPQTASKPPGPLFVSDQFFVYALAASHAMPPEAQWLLLERGQPLRSPIPKSYGRFYLYDPSENLLRQVQSQYRVKPFTSAFWQVDSP